MNYNVIYNKSTDLTLLRTALEATGVAGTNESWSLYVRHNGTDYLVQTVSSAAATKVFSNTSLNIPYVAGDIVRMVFVNPTWATNPTNVVGGGFLTLQ